MCDVRGRERKTERGIESVCMRVWEAERARNKREVERV
jgi:hypothetical protein